MNPRQNKQKSNKKIQFMSDYPIFDPRKYREFSTAEREPLHFTSSLAQPYNPQKFNQSYSPISNMHSQKLQNSMVTGTSSKYYPAPISTKETYKEETIREESRIQYVPFTKKVIDYVDQPRYQVVPKKKTITDYLDAVEVQYVPRERIQTDYYAIQHMRSYIPQKIDTKTIQYVPIERKKKRNQYIPVQRTIIHYPEHLHDKEIPQYLGVQPSRTGKKYTNLRECDITFWEKQYGYKRGEPIDILNQKIKQKYQKDKNQYFSQFTTSNQPKSPKFIPI